MSVKHINIKTCTYYFFDDIINMRDSDTNNTKIDEKWDKNIFFTILDIKKDLSIYSVNSLCLIFGMWMDILKTLIEIISNASSYQWKQRKNKKVWRTVD